jgi:hypothetical protein
MADNVYQYGFKWCSTLAAGDERPATIPCRVATAYAPTTYTTCDLRPGDPVILLSTGYVRLAAAGDPVYGVIDGIGQYYDGTRVVKKQSLPYGTTYTAGDAQESIVHVIKAEGQVFEVCCDETLSSPNTATRAGAIAMVGGNCDHTFANYSGRYLNTALDQSTWLLASGQWRIIELSRRPGEDYTGNFPMFRVTVNEPMGAGAGVTTNTAA